MQLIVAVQELAAPGGPQTYALTIAEQLARLGHHVTLFARRLGATADLARSRCLAVEGRADDLPERADGVIVGVDRSLAIELAARYPAAARVFVVHGADDVHLPPPLDGVVAATVALSDAFAARAAACAGAGEVVRLRQPVDLRRFGGRAAPAPRPARALLLGNYHGGGVSRAQLIRDAWSPAGVTWEQVGHPSPQLDVADAMRDVDVVVGYGRSIVEAMACGRPAYVFDHAGCDGWVTPESYERIEAAGFSGLSAQMPPDAARLRADLDAYRPELGRLGFDLVRRHHDARAHAAELVALLRRIAPEPAPAERSALRALALLAEAQLRAEVARDHHSLESRQWFRRAQELNDELAAQREEAARSAEALRLRAAAAEARVDALRGTKRFRLAQALARPAELARRARSRSRARTRRRPRPHPRERP